MVLATPGAFGERGGGGRTGARAGWRRHVHVAALSTLLFLPQSTAAQVPAEANLYKGWTVAKLTIVGLDKSLAGDLEDGLALSGRSSFLSKTRAMFLASTLEEDIARTRLFLARHGHPDARVQVRFEPTLARRRLGIVLEIDPGPRVRIADVTVDGMDPAAWQELATKLPVVPGADYNEAEVRAGADAITQALRDRGYSGAATRVRVERDSTASARVIYHVEPGPVRYFGAVHIAGVAPDLVPVARRTTDIRRGRTYSPTTLKHADENLRLLGLFRRVEITTRSVGSDTVDVHCELEESLHRSLQTGVGFWSDDRWRLQAGWKDSNLFKRGRGLSVKGDFSQFLQEATFSYWRPTVLTTRTRLTLDLEFSRQDEESYESIGTELEAALTRNLSFESTLRAAVATSWTDFQDVSGEPPEGEGLLTSLAFDATHDGTNDRMWPTAGGHYDNHVEWGLPGFVSNSHYILDEVRAALYRGVGAGFVCMSRLRVGLAEPLRESTELVPNKLFYSGGSTSMRGFGRNQLGPKDEENRPIGGEAKLEASAEIRFPVIKILWGSLFVDTGQVWSQIEAMRFDDVEVAWGGGLMLKTPIGPMRVDVGHRVTEYDTSESLTVWHFSIGNAF
jgi:outer membrane protein insertion porin family